MACLAHSALATPARTRHLAPKAVRTPCTSWHAWHGLARPLCIFCFCSLATAAASACTHPFLAGHGTAWHTPHRRTRTPSTACTATAPQHTTQPRRQHTPPEPHANGCSLASASSCMKLLPALTCLTSHVHPSAQFRKETPWLRPWEKATIRHQCTKTPDRA